jgi:hypothetical protein
MFINIKKRLQMEGEGRREENLMEVCKGRIITKHICNHLLPLLFVFFVSLPLLQPLEHQFVV